MLKLDAIVCTLANLNTRAEKVGKKATRPAADVKLHCNIPNTQLEEIETGLLLALYKAANDEGHQSDAFVDPSTLTTRRFPDMKPPSFGEKWPGYFLSIAPPAGYDSESVELDKVTLTITEVKPLDGGTVQIQISLAGNPTREEIGVLYDLMGKEVAATLNPPSLTTLAELRKAAPKADTEEEDLQGSEEEQHALPEVSAGRAFPDAIDARGETPPSVRKARAKAPPEHAMAHGAGSANGPKVKPSQRPKATTTH